MIRFQLSVEDLADTRFAITPIQETVLSLWALRDPGRYPLHLPWHRSIQHGLDTLNTELLLSLVGPTFALPDFLTPRPTVFAPDINDELATVCGTPLDVVRRDLIATYAPSGLPDTLAAATESRDAPVARLLADICDQLQRYWDVAIAPTWPQLRLLLEADMTYRARRLATGGARLLFADLHPNVRWRDGTLHIDKMIGKHTVAVCGRGLMLLPSLFAYKPVPPMSPEEPPWLAYPCRGAATLWAPAPAANTTALASLLGAPRTGLLNLLEEPVATVEIARRLKVTPSAVSQHLRVLHATGLVTRARAGRNVLYHRSTLGDQLINPPTDQIST
jgi:DNA-binding transcriptional ArsR family regulator